MAMAEIAQRDQLETVISSAQSLSLDVNHEMDALVARALVLRSTIERQREVMAMHLKELSARLIDGTSEGSRSCERRGREGIVCLALSS